MLNMAFLVGRLGRHPEIRHTKEGHKVASFRLATSEYYKGTEKTEWHQVTCWDEVLCDVLASRCKTGTLVAIVGTIRTRTYEGKDGQQKYATEIILDRFGSKLQVIAGGIAKDERENKGIPDPNAPLPPSANRGTGGRYSDLDDEIPW